MKTYVLLFTIIFCLFSCGNSGSRKNNASEKLSDDKDTCDNPDAPLSCLFVNLPEDLSNKMEIADNADEGVRIIIKGQIFKDDGVTPYNELIIYAYHTDNKGYYTKKGDET